jgi:hypothetical protein
MLLDRRRFLHTTGLLFDARGRRHVAEGGPVD